MSRVTADPVFTSPSSGRNRTAPGALDLIRADAPRFDEHLQRAAQTPPSTTSEPAPRAEELAPQPSESRPPAEEPTPRAAQAEPERQDEGAADTAGDSGQSESEANAAETTRDCEPEQTTEASAEQPEQDTKTEEGEETSDEKPSEEAVVVEPVSKELCLEEPADDEGAKPTDVKAKEGASDGEKAGTEAKPVRRAQGAAHIEPSEKAASAAELSGLKLVSEETQPADAEKAKSDEASSKPHAKVQEKPREAGVEVKAEDVKKQDAGALAVEAAEVVGPPDPSGTDRAGRQGDRRSVAKVSHAAAAKTGEAQDDSAGSASLAGQTDAPEATQKTTEQAVSTTKVAIDAVQPEPAPGVPSAMVREASGPGRGSVGEATRAGAPPADPHSEGPSQADRVRFVERVSRALGSMDREGGVLRMRLHPAELGSMRLEVSLRSGVMTARLETDTPETRNLLLDNLPALRDRLAQQEIKIERFEVTYHEGGFGGGLPEAPDERHTDRGAAGRRAEGLGGMNEGDAVGSASPRGVSLPGYGSQLDVVV